MSLDNRNILPLDELLRKYPNLRSLNLSQNKLTDVRGFVDQGSKQQLLLQKKPLKKPLYAGTRISLIQPPRPV